MPSQTTFTVANETQRKATIQAVDASGGRLGGAGTIRSGGSARLGGRRAAALAAWSAAGIVLVLMAASTPAAYAATGTAPPAPSSRTSTPPAPNKTAKGMQTGCSYLPFSGPTWMHDIAICLRSRKLGEIVIPGSHDSATFGLAPGQGLDLATTQDKNLTDQLDDGMRQFDIRVEWHDGDSGLDYYAHHGSGITDQISHWLTLKSIFTAISQWAHVPGHEQEIIMLNFTMDPPTDTYNEDDCGMFGPRWEAPC